MSTTQQAPAAGQTNTAPSAANVTTAAPPSASPSAPPPSATPQQPRHAHSSSSSYSSSSSSHPPPPPAPWEPRSINLYKAESMSLIGEGTYGSVWLARGPNGQKVALKKIRKEKKEGFPITAIREIKILKSLRHPNIVSLKDVVSSHMPGKEGDVFLVFEFLDHDLTGLLESKVHLTDAVCKYYLQKILEGLAYMHSRSILHRDIKGANILLSNTGDVKIADFGLARAMGKGGYTNRVVTLWYRAPELLLGSSEYDAKIDLWSVGCLFAELLTRGSVLFPGSNTELDQLNKIYDICGTPNEENWPGVSQLKYFQQFTPKPKKRVLRQMFSNQRSAAAVDLLDKLLTLNPADRLSAEQALDHEYFFEEPLPAQPPAFQGNFHEYGSKQRKRGGAGGRQAQGGAQQQQQAGGHHPSHDPAGGAPPGNLDRLTVVPHPMGGGLGGFQQMNRVPPPQAQGGGGGHYGAQQQQGAAGYGGQAHGGYAAHGGYGNSANHPSYHGGSHPPSSYPSQQAAHGPSSGYHPSSSSTSHSSAPYHRGPPGAGGGGGGGGAPYRGGEREREYERGRERGGDNRERSRERYGQH